MATLNPINFIETKKTGGTHSPEDIHAFIQGIVTGKIPDYQAAAWLMAAWQRGLSLKETASLTSAMLESGERCHFERPQPHASKVKNGLRGSKAKSPPLRQQTPLFVDKHSTGGVGDKISLPLAPLLMSLGFRVPMVAGRGLGHTGGTVDKLETIPGFSTQLPLSQFQSQVENLGCALMGQTDQFVPADKILYGLRDVTATVDHPSLITASILSKKVAEGIRYLVLDLKVGRAAFMKDLRQAKVLAGLLSQVGKQLGVRTRCVLTSMETPIGYTVGNSLEILETLDLLEGKNNSRLGITQEAWPVLAQDSMDLTLELASHLLVMTGRARGPALAWKMAREALTSGRALACWKSLLKAQGVSADLLEPENLRRALPLSSKFWDLKAAKSGYLSDIDGLTWGLLSVDLGGGRQKKTDSIDGSVGIVLHTPWGARVEKGQTLARVYFNESSLRCPWNEIQSRIAASVTIGTKPTRKSKTKKGAMGSLRTLAIMETSR